MTSKTFADATLPDKRSPVMSVLTELDNPSYHNIFHHAANSSEPRRSNRPCSRLSLLPSPLPPDTEPVLMAVATAPNHCQFRASSHISRHIPQGFRRRPSQTTASSVAETRNSNLAQPPSHPATTTTYVATSCRPLHSLPFTHNMFDGMRYPHSFSFLIK